MHSFARPLTAAAAIAVTATLGLTACAGADDESSLTVGATAVPAGEILQYLVDSGQAEEAGLDLEVQEFADYTTPNQALSDGSIDANLFQHGPFLETYNEESGGDLVNVGEVYLPPLALYSRTVDDVADLPEGAEIALPNDVSNESRALLLLADQGLIETTENPTTVDDITENPNDYQFSEIDAASLPQALDEMDAAIVNFSFAAPAGLSSDLQLFAEGTGSEYYNILATRAELEGDERVATLYELLTSDETADWIVNEYGGLVEPAE